MNCHEQILTAVEQAVSAGLCVIPPAEDGSKRPQPGKTLSWSQYQNHRPLGKELDDWYKGEKRTGVGLVCGKVSGNLEVLDIDDTDVWEPFTERAKEWGLDELLEKLMAGYFEQTPGGACHILYRCPLIGGNQKLATRPKLPEEKKHSQDQIRVCIETRGEGGYIITAPSYGSVHPTGKPYVLVSGGFASIATITPEEREDLLDLARSFHLPDKKKIASDLKTISSETNGSGKPGDDFINKSTWGNVLAPHGWELIKTVGGVGYWQKPGGKGGAIHATTNYAGSDLLYVFSTATGFQAERGYSKFSAYTLLSHDGDFKAAAKAIKAEGYAKDEAHVQNEGKSGQSQADILLGLTADLDLFHDQNGDAFFFNNGQCIKLRSGSAKKFLSYLMYQNVKRTPNSEALSQVVATLEGIALFDREERQLENRVAIYDGDILYDLGNHNAVRVTGNDWNIIKAPPKFRRFSHQAVQVIPETGGDVSTLFKFINVAPSHRLLVQVTLITFFIPGIPHPIFHPWGPQGSGKTSLFRAFKRLVDPSIVETLMCSSDRHRVIHALVSHYMPLFDNLSRLDGETSDILCQACTGGGIEQRQLYTDCDSIIFLILRCVGVNGVNLSIAKPDLLDRTLLLHLERIPPSERREESVLWAEFELARPHILGGIFDILSKAMAIYPTVKLDKLPRLADYGRWGYAIAEAIKPGLGKQFVTDYEQNIQLQVDEAVQSNTLATTLLSYMAKRPGKEWNSTINKAFEVLKIYADPDRFDKSFPAAPRELRRHLERLKSTLEERGLTYSIGARTAEGYPIVFSKLDNFASVSSFATSAKSPSNAPNASDASNAAKSADLDVAEYMDQV